jgi:hypothetical protein
MVNAGSMASAKCSEDLENILPERHKSLQMPLAPLPITKVRFDKIPSGETNLIPTKPIYSWSSPYMNFITVIFQSIPG